MIRNSYLDIQRAVEVRCFLPSAWIVGAALAGRLRYSGGRFLGGQPTVLQITRLPASINALNSVVQATLLLRHGGRDMTEYNLISSASQPEKKSNPKKLTTEEMPEEHGGQVIPFSGGKDLISKDEITTAVQLWRFERDLSDALTREELGAMKMVNRMDAQRKTLLIGFAMYLRKHQRSDVAMGVYLVQMLLSDNEAGLATVSQPTLAKMFNRSVSSIADAQRRLKEDGLVVMTRGRYAGTQPVIPRFVTEQYNHLAWIVGALSSSDKPSNLQVPPDDCQSTGPAGGLSQSTGPSGGLKPVNHPVEPSSIIRRDPIQLHRDNSTTLNRAASVVATGIAAAMASLPAAAQPPSPPAIIVQPSHNMRDVSDRLFEAAGNAMRRGNAGLEVMSTPRNWLDNGCDLEMDILPTVREIALRKPPHSISTWSFFSAAIMDAKTRRTAPLPQGNAAPKAVFQDRQERQRQAEDSWMSRIVVPATKPRPADEVV